MIIWAKFNAIWKFVEKSEHQNEWSWKDSSLRGNSFFRLGDCCHCLLRKGISFARFVFFFHSFPNCLIWYFIDPVEFVGNILKNTDPSIQHWWTVATVGIVSVCLVIVIVQLCYAVLRTASSFARFCCCVSTIIIWFSGFFSQIKAPFGKQFSSKSLKFF